ncbi:helix-turn-helix domain-containing protein [Hymenobacter sp. BT186]|uniref:Helix-turn-helix domain-containing protein n=1 Tax=Hymenobacter telluris TaxID=2816474 RepID=A0A939JAY8_9BACT|nr:helix-turn-helix domain-containing protein [Hymenobacter telluris]MBW3374627.1 helix-turn-helix domain-containing protein [Hymenobacter norwichensis]
MDIIALEDQAFWELVKRVTDELVAKHGQKALDRWIDGAEAMHLLRIKSPTTLQKLRDTGAIRYSQPEKKIILYDRESIISYIEKHVKNPF